MDNKFLEAKTLERYAFLLTRRHLKVTFLPENVQELGYTNGQKKEVFIAWEHELFKDLTPTQKALMRKGVFSHELLHQLLTNFTYTEKICRSFKTQTEAQIFMTFANTLEDPAIEYFADKCLADDYVDALKYSIRHIYITSKEINTSKNAFSQLVNALIHFGDMGLIKGEFTFPEAKEAFIKIAPLYNKGITEPNNKKRLDIALECMNLAKPLWEEEVKAEEEFMEFLKNFAKQMMQSDMSDANLGAQMDMEGLDGEGQESEEEGEEDENNSSASSSSGQTSSIAKRRNEISKQLEQSQNKSSSDDSSSDDSSSDNESSNDNSSNDESSNSNSSNDKSESSSNQTTDEECNKEIAERMSDNEANVQDALDLLCKNNKEANNTAENDLEIDENSNETKIKNDLEVESNKQKRNSESDFDCIEKIQEKLNTYDTIVKPGGSSVNQYSKLCNACRSDINYLSKTLRKLFEQDLEETLHFTSGKYNVLRGEMNTTAKVFDKKRIPSGINDMAVILCVDTSGSMKGPKMANAQIAATMLTEACAKINVPCYVMGFSNGHTHFSSWKYNKLQASSIAKMSAGGGTNDTKAVMFATELLKMQNAEHKFMFVISDGEGNYGLADAVKDARKIANVFAIGIGNIDTEYFQQVYKQDFLHLTSANGLAKKLSTKVIKLAKRSANK